MVGYLVDPDAEGARFLRVYLDPVKEGVRGEATSPAEPKATHGAVHVWAAAILLDDGLAPGTVARLHADEALLPLGHALIEAATAPLTMILLSAELAGGLLAPVTRQFFAVASQPLVQD